MRPLLQGEPIVLAGSGQLIDRNTRRERLTSVAWPRRPG
jgi:uncharacterized membrane protein YcaP (DUF421 family)